MTIIFTKPRRSTRFQKTTATVYLIVAVKYLWCRVKRQWKIGARAVCTLPDAAGFRVQDLGFRVQGLGFTVQGFEFKA